MARYNVTRYVREYKPWSQSDESPRLNDSWHEEFGFSHLREVANFLVEQGVTNMCTSEVCPRTWLIAESYTNPYTGFFDEVTVSRDEGFTDREWMAVVRTVVTES